MENSTYIESGILELYVYGLLTEQENLDVSKMAKQYNEIHEEIIAIEKSIVNLSTSFSPFLSADNFRKIKEKLELKHAKVIEIEPSGNRSQYFGWAAAILLLMASGYEFSQLKQSRMQMANTEIEKTKLQDALATSEIKIKQSDDALTVVRDMKNTAVNLAGQAVSPDCHAKVYYNKQTRVVYVDAEGLPEPPEGKVYQVWALKLNPLTPTSIGLLEQFKGNNKKMFAVENANDAEGFGITLEPTGGSKSPTMEQLYAMGKV